MASLKNRNSSITCSAGPIALSHNSFPMQRHSFGMSAFQFARRSFSNRIHKHLIRRPCRSCLGWVSIGASLYPRSLARPMACRAGLAAAETSSSLRSFPVQLRDRGGGKRSGDRPRADVFCLCGPVAGAVITVVASLHSHARALFHLLGADGVGRRKAPQLLELGAVRGGWLTV